MQPVATHLAASALVHFHRHGQNRSRGRVEAATEPRVRLSKGVTKVFWLIRVPANGVGELVVLIRPLSTFIVASVSRCASSWTDSRTRSINSGFDSFAAHGCAHASAEHMLRLLEDNLRACGQSRTKPDGFQCSRLGKAGGTLLQSTRKAAIALVLLDGQQNEVCNASSNVDQSSNRSNAAQNVGQLVGLDIRRPDVVERVEQPGPSGDAAHRDVAQRHLGAVEVEEVHELNGLALTQKLVVDAFGLVVEFELDWEDFSVLCVGSTRF